MIHRQQQPFQAQRRTALSHPASLPLGMGGIDRLTEVLVLSDDLLAVISDFESLVAAGLLHGTRQEAAHFLSGWLAFEDHARASPVSCPDSLRLIVLPGLAKDDG